MIIISDTIDFKLPEETAVALGKFDGIHLGHRELLRLALQKKDEGLRTAVFTFSPSPMVFFGKGEGKELSTLEEKREIFEKMGVDYLIEYPLNKESASISPQAYITDILHQRMKMKYIVSGKDVSFGDKGKGDAALLTAYGEKLSYEVQLIDKVVCRGITVSSSEIRKVILEGDMEKAEAFLGSPYSIAGEVLHGKALGRTLGFPTVNVIPQENKILPPKGVYFTLVEIAGRKYPGITNIGNKPTVSNVEQTNVETHILDYAGDLYGKNIRVELLKYQRGECKFPSLEALTTQIETDKNNAYRYFENKNLFK